MYLSAASCCYWLRPMCINVCNARQANAYARVHMRWGRWQSDWRLPCGGLGWRKPVAAAAPNVPLLTLDLLDLVCVCLYGVFVLCTSSDEGGQERQGVRVGTLLDQAIYISCAWVIELVFSATLLSNLVLLDSLIRLSESFLMMYRSGGRSRGPTRGSISPEVPRISDLAG